VNRGDNDGAGPQSGQGSRLPLLRWDPSARSRRTEALQEADREEQQQADQEERQDGAQEEALASSARSDWPVSRISWGGLLFIHIEIKVFDIFMGITYDACNQNYVLTASFIIALRYPCLSTKTRFSIFLWISNAWGRL